MNFLGIIPARYASSRFPGKPLADIWGKPMIQRVYEQVRKVLDNVVVATDDQRIFDAVQAFGGSAVMTSTSHKTGTDRCFEAYTKMDKPFDVVINIQGDEPFIDPVQIKALMACFDSEKTDIATLVKSYSLKTPFLELENPNSPKVVVNKNNEAMYFSRSVIPFVRGDDKENWTSLHQFYHHIGIYAYKTDVLAEIVKMPQTALEKAESLEQLRWLENGLCIKVAITDAPNFSIDTPEDIEHLPDCLKKY